MGLKDGKHTFDFIVDEKFFDEFEYSEIKNGQFDVIVELEKNATFLALVFIASGSLEMKCDRCLEKFDLKINSHDKLIIKFGNEVYDSRYIGEEVQIVSHNQSEINVSQYIYEFIHLQLPYKRMHPNDENGNPTCNIEALNKPGEQKTQKDKTIDPRWDKLKDLLK